MLTEGRLPSQRPESVDEWIEQTKETGIIDFEQLARIAGSLVRRTVVHKVQHGWSMIGHYYVTIQATEATPQVTLICNDKRQAESIASALHADDPLLR